MKRYLIGGAVAALAVAVGLWARKSRAVPVVSEASDVSDDDLDNDEPHVPGEVPNRETPLKLTFEPAKKGDCGCG